MKYFILIALFFVLIPADVSASGLSSGSASTVIPVQKEIAYDLPYPGILPDNPLYIFKTLRDRIVSFLINDPLKKAEFDLLSSDKRLNAAVYLVKKGEKGTLASSTVSKSNNYFFEAIQALHEAKKQGEKTGDLAGRMRLSIGKHEQLGKDIEKNVDPKYRGEVIVEEKRMDQFAAQLNSQ